MSEYAMEVLHLFDSWEATERAYISQLGQHNGAANDLRMMKEQYEDAVAVLAREYDTKVQLLQDIETLREENKRLEGELVIQQEMGRECGANDYYKNQTIKALREEVKRLNEEINQQQQQQVEWAKAIEDALYQMQKTTEEVLD